MRFLYHFKEIKLYYFPDSWINSIGKPSGPGALPFFILKTTFSNSDDWIGLKRASFISVVTKRGIQSKMVRSLVSIGRTSLVKRLEK